MSMHDSSSSFFLMALQCWVLILVMAFSSTAMAMFTVSVKTNISYNPF